MRRVMLVAMALMMFSGLVFATGEAEDESGVTELLWNLWDDPARNGQGTIVETFNAANPDINVTLEQIPYGNYEDKIRTVLAAGEAPDIVQVNDDYVVTYTKRNLIQPLTGFLEDSDLDPEDFYQAIWDFPWYEGELMAIAPLNKVRFLAYNRDLLREAGLPDPPTDWGNPDWDWDTLLEYAQALTKTEGNRTTQWGIAILGDGATEQIFTYANNGEGLFSEDGQTCSGCNEEGKEAIQYLADLVHEYGVHPQWGEVNASGSTDNLFLSGQAAIVSSITGQISTYRDTAEFDWGIAPYPIAPGKPEWANAEGSLVTYAIPREAANPEAAWQLLEFMFGESSQRVFASVGMVPANKNYTDGVIDPNAPGENMEVAVNGMEYHESVNFTEYTDQAKRIYREYLHPVWAGDMEVGPAMDRAAAEIDPVLQGE